MNDKLKIILQKLNFKEKILAINIISRYRYEFNLQTNNHYYKSIIILSYNYTIYSLFISDNDIYYNRKKLIETNNINEYIIFLNKYFILRCRKAKIQNMI